MGDVVGAWHQLVHDNDPDAIPALLAEDAEFNSPIVHTPQKGRAAASMYLRTALTLLNTPSFRYIGQWTAPDSAVLEFEGVIEGITVNGVDMIWWNDAGQITRFKVMVRPLKAVNLLHQHMAQRLAAFPPA